MKKTFFLFIAFLAGCFLGYSDLFSSRLPGGKSLSEKEAHAAGRAPAPTMMRRGDSGSQLLPTENTLSSFLRKYTEFSPQQTRVELERLLKQKKESRKDNDALSQAILYLAYKLGSQSPDDVKRLLEDKGNRENRSLYSALLEGWAETDFEGSMNYLRIHKNELNGAFSFFKKMTEKLITKDPDKAVKWLSSLASEERRIVLERMAESLPRQHPGRMTEFMAALTPREASSIVSTLCSSGWAAADWDSFQDWADTLKGGKRNEVLSLAIRDIAAIDLGKATEELKKMDAKYRDRIGEYILSTMGDEKKSEGKALDWVLENRESFSDLSSLMEDAMNTWSGYSTLAEKALQLPEGELRDAALAGLLGNHSSGIMPGDSEENATRKVTGLLELAEKIGDFQKRDSSVRKCVENWLYRYPKASRQWIAEKSAFSPQVKQELLEKCDRRQKAKESEYF